MKKILFYTDTPQLGGAENQMFLLAKYLPKEYQVTLACSSYLTLNPWCQKFMDLGIPVIRLKVFHKHDPRHFFYLRKIIDQFDIIHAHLWNPASCRYVFLIAKNRPLIAMEHDPFVLKGIKGWMKRKLLPRAKRIIVASSAARNLVLEQLPSLEEKIRVVANGIDISDFHKRLNPDERNEFRRSNFKANPNEKIVLCLAELHERKGQKYLLLAIPEILKGIPNVKFVFAGEGPMQRSYEKLAQANRDRMLFLGRRKDVQDLLSASDLLVLPSIREAFGLVLLEAGAAGVPVVATEVGGIPEIIQNDKTGLLVPAKSKEALTQAIILLLKNPLKAQEMAKSAKIRVETAFDARTMAKRTAEVYDEILT